jgi:hypothetical protein
MLVLQYLINPNHFKQHFLHFIVSLSEYHLVSKAYAFCAFAE